MRKGEHSGEAGKEQPARGERGNELGQRLRGGGLKLDYFLKFSPSLESTHTA